MLCDWRPDLESKNFVDGSMFTKQDHCIWVVYPSGAAGDLLVSIIDKHYLRTGCEYYGINNRGKVMLYASDYGSINTVINNGLEITFDDQWLYDFSDQLGQRNLVYSMLDQIIFSCHLWQSHNIKKIIANFPKAKIINIYPKDSVGLHLLENLAASKLLDRELTTATFDLFRPYDHVPELVHHTQVLNLPFGCLFDRQSYDRHYKITRDFLGLTSSLISFDFIEFYLSKQHSTVQSLLTQYSRTL